MATRCGGNGGSLWGSSVRAEALRAQRFLVLAETRRVSTVPQAPFNGPKLAARFNFASGERLRRRALLLRVFASPREPNQVLLCASARTKNP